MDFLSQIDMALFEILSGNCELWSVFIWVGIICAKFLIYILPLHLCALWFCGGYRERQVTLSICISICIALLVGYLISCIYFRPRPFVTYLEPPLIKHQATASFPSNHALVVSAYMSSLYFYRYKTASRFALILLCLVCWGRVFTGVHYPFDVLVGSILGGLVSWVVSRFIASYFPDFLYHIPPLKYNLKTGIRFK
ncbi:undecaprenyl-diphosphatase [Bartonella sp. F02]|uniref:undecaprenyl-diphosphatase n=1 Tax=Bartonella sp. F02 TaxID=2967262 RepID=UPI0022A930F4|nr:undecaprenyl-diphosphatase [Bartonella sp. F02]MCZ2328554.1 undecaprenyl-diphosphatase [Bartonella sp. F02]